MKKYVSIILLLCSCVFAMNAQDEVSPKREFRAAWLTTVWAIDWPSTRDNTASAEAAQKREMQQILDRFVAANMNACFFQVRTMCDAYYNSAYEPWSQWLCGERGKAPNYDPFAFVIEEAHKRGIEVHAWLNPYRYASSSGTYGTLPTDYTNTHPDWLIQYEDHGSSILNPGLPEVRQRIVDIVQDIMSKYDVDGIVFDDYFYNQGTLAAHDSAQYRLYNPDGLGLADWRRQNVNKMVQMVYDTIKAEKPWVRFGIGPAGVAASSSSVASQYGVTPCPSGSDWQYNGIYSDPLAWVSSRSIDYISPQVYWVIGASSGDYSKVTPWWYMVANKFDRHCYISASLSNLSAAYAPANDGMSHMERIASATAYLPSETVNEIRINRSSSKEAAPGMVFFSAAKLTTRGFKEALVSDVYTHEAIVPAMTWYTVPEQGLVSDLSLTGDTLTWTYDTLNVRFGVYAIPVAERNVAQALTSAKYYQGMAYDRSFTLPSGVSASTHAIAVSVIDRYGNEFAPRFLGESLLTPVTPVLLSPADNADILLPTYLSWQPVADAAGYTVEISYDSAFSSLVMRKQVDTCAFLTKELYNLDGSRQTYWRVKANAANRLSNWSAARSFTGRVFSVIYPSNSEGAIPVAPTIRWDDAGPGTSYHMEVATANTFKSSEIVFSVDTTSTQVTLPGSLLRYGTNYYVRVKATSSYMDVESATNMFTTEDLVMVAPEVVYPAEGDTIHGQSIRIRWSETPNNGFRVELSTASTFTARQLKVKTVEMDNYSVAYDDMADGTYYVRVKTKTNESYTDPSPAVSFVYVAQEPVQDAIHDVNANKAQKIVENGQVYILRGGKKFTILGTPAE